MYTIKRAAELTGISVATLRAWERRYGVVHPRRSDGGYRLYDQDDVRALSIMNALVNDGWSAREAAEETRSRLDAGPDTSSWPPGASRGSSPESSPESSPVGAPGEVDGAVNTVTELRRRRVDDGGRGVGEPGGWGARQADLEAFVEAAARLDAVAAGEVLDERFAFGTFEHVVDDWLMPALERVGEAWADGRVTVAGEHLVSYAVQRRLAAAYEAAAARADGPAVLIGLPSGARHELGLLAFAVGARRAGFATTYVGADLPVGDWVGAVATRRARAVVLSVPRRVDITPARQIVAGLRAADPGLVIGVGGRFQYEVDEDCVHLGHSISVAVGELVRRLRVPA